MSNNFRQTSNNTGVPPVSVVECRNTRTASYDCKMNAPAQPDTKAHKANLAEASNALRSRPGYLLRRCLQNTSSLFDQACSDTGITMRQYDVLFVLDLVGDMTQGELSHLLDIDRSTNALVVRLLEEKHLIDRWNHPRDSRKKCVRLTKTGRDTLQQVQPRAQAAAQSLLSALAPGEQQALLDALNKVIDSSPESPGDNKG